MKKIPFMLMVGFMAIASAAPDSQDSNNSQEGYYEDMFVDSVYDSNLSADRESSTQSNVPSQQSSNQVVGGNFSLAELLEGARKNYNLEAKDIAILQAKAT